jgi:hypothetical protein
MHDVSLQHETNVSHDSALLEGPWPTDGGSFKLFGHLVRLLERVISPSQCVYLHRTAQHRKTTKTSICLEGNSNRRAINSTVQTALLTGTVECAELEGDRKLRQIDTVYRI